MKRRLSLNELKIIVEKIVKEELDSASITIRDLQDDWEKYFPRATYEEEIQLITNSQDVKMIHDDYPEAREFDSFFVLIVDGDYDNIYGFEGSVPALNKYVTKIV
jgi:hypothetical protein